MLWEGLRQGRLAHFVWLPLTSLNERDFADLSGRLEPASRQWFTKLSYAWQH